VPACRSPACRPCERNGGRAAHGGSRAEHGGGRRRRSFWAQGPIAIISPPSVDHLIQRGEFLTAYTPYQPEIAQGTLQMLFEFQTQVARLFGMRCRQCSMYDGSTACWEAMAWRARHQAQARQSCSSAGCTRIMSSVAKTMAKLYGDALDTAWRARTPAEPDR
jgi:glycine cleavage system pyridoxal-binding protein P